MRFRDAYLAGNPRASALLTPTFLDAEARTSAVHAATRGVHPAVVAEIRERNANAPDHPARRAALPALDGDVAFVVTGQQVGLFGGPLYALHKAAAAVSLARRLSRESGRTVLPLFWLQSEDHDVDEVSSTTVVDRHGGVHRLHHVSNGAPRASLAARILDADVADAVEAARDALDGLPFADDVGDLLAACWRAGRRHVDAFGATMLALFAHTELLVFDPRRRSIAALAAPVHRRAIEAHTDIADILAMRSGALAAAGFGDQVPLRPDCALTCLHPDGVDGPRFRLRACDADTWECAGYGACGTTGALLDRIEQDPLCVSTTALLRPLVQDTLLPVAAYVGGPAEVAYFAQNAPLYDRFELRMPMIVPRPTWRWVPPEVRTILDRHEVPADALDRGVDAALERIAGDPGVGDEARDRLLAAIEHELDAIVAGLDDVEGEIARARRRTRNTMARYAGRFGERIDRARARADRARLSELAMAAGWLAPGGASAERSLCFAPFAALVGADALVTRAIDVADPLCPPPAEVDL